MPFGRGRGFGCRGWGGGWGRGNFHSLYYNLPWMPRGWRLTPYAGQFGPTTPYAGYGYPYDTGAHYSTPYGYPYYPYY